MKLTAVVSGDRDIAARFDRLPEAEHRRLHETIESLTARLFAAVRPPSRTGRAASEKRMSVTETPDMVRGTVTFAATGTEAAKIGTLEWGAPGKRSRPPVSEHKRSLNHLWGHSISPIEVIVDRYKRKAHITEYRFLRNALAAIQSDAERELREAAEGAARETIAG